MHSLNRSDVKKVASVAFHLPLFGLYWLSGWMPRSPDLWVFGCWGGYRFADNAAAFFVHVHEMRAAHEDVQRAVWVSRRIEVVKALRRHGYEAHWAWSPRGLACCLRAGTYVFDCFSKDINFWTSRGARKLNLWSGVPIKTFERDIDKGDSRYYKLFHGNPLERVLMAFLMPWHVQRPDLLICTSETMREIVCRAFDVPAHRVQVTGYPRNDLMLRCAGITGDPRDSENLSNIMSTELPASFVDAVESDATVFLYLPTFRDDSVAYLDIDWSLLDEHLERIGSKLFCKFHPQDETHVPGRHRYIEELPRPLDLPGLMAMSDVLISDYSSIIFDYMLLRRDIICFLPDHDRFLSRSRSLNFELDELGFSQICRTGDELMSAMTESAERLDATATDSSTERRDIALHRFHRFTDDGSTGRVIDAVTRQPEDLATGERAAASGG